MRNVSSKEAALTIVGIAVVLVGFLYLMSFFKA
jgi:hypothetical protein